MFILGNDYKFPPVELANKGGILAIGGDLNPKRLLKAYQNGIFPWFNDGEPIIWYAPDPRMVLKPKEVYISKSMRKVLRDGQFKVTFNRSFEKVINACQTINRKDQFGTWLTDDLKKSLIELHQMDYAKSVEVWQDDDLVGGLYGIDLGDVFCGDSMFSYVSNASKVAFIYLCQYLEESDYKLLDCQIYNEHLASLGAYEIPREQYMRYLR